MAKVITAPETEYSLEVETAKYKVFLAGGITNCPDWQSQVIEKMKYIPDVVIYNPRRQEFDVSNPNESEKQIIWEHKHLEQADIIAFWFSAGSDNPIVLYEYGKYIRSDKKLIVGADSDYSRIKDVYTQTKVIYPQFDLNRTFDEFLHALKYTLVKHELDTKYEDY